MFKVSQKICETLWNIFMDRHTEKLVKTIVRIRKKFYSKILVIDGAEQHIYAC